MDISTILPLLTGMNGGNGSDLTGLMGMMGANQGGGDMSALLGALGGMQGNNGMAGLMNMFGGMQNAGAGNASNVNNNTLEQDSVNKAASVNNTGSGDNSQMMNMLPLLFNMMNGGASGNNPTASDTAQAAQDIESEATGDESDINYKLYKLLQEQARKGI